MKKAIIFIHGLGGDSVSSWGNFASLIESDDALNTFDVGFFSYPTRLARFFPFIQARYGSIQDLADALDSLIRVDYKEYDDIILVAHSLGGLIARKYLLDKKLSGGVSKVKKLLLYAVPHSGSGLANISSFVSFYHRHIKQLCKESDFLDNLNDQWSKSKLSETLDIQCVIGLADEVVGSESLKGFCRYVSNETHKLADKNHKSIIKPTDANDMSFKVLKEFVLKKLSVVNSQLEQKQNFIQWQDQIKQNDFIEFVEDEERQKLIQLLEQKLLSSSGQTLRVIGLSGLGKTRLVYEVFNSNESLAQDVIYLDMAVSRSEEIFTEVQRLLRFDYEGNIVLDNCDLDSHKRFEGLQKSSNSKINIITIDYNIENYHGDVLEIKRLSDESVKKILQNNSSFAKLEDLDRIVQFADGFAQMAVMLATARLNFESNIGVLKDDDLVKKMLWGNSAKDSDEEKILEHFAILDKCEFDDGEEFKYIVNYLGLDADKSHKTIVRFQKRGIIDRRGKFIKIVPKPLALCLATKWWDETRKEKIVNFITSELPGILQESLCLQIEKLYLSKTIQKTIETVCKESEPFGQAEKILTFKGSRLFRSFAMVNPQVISQVLYRVIFPMDDEEVSRIAGDVRRNLVWTLERLCFREDTFLESAQVLFRFAVCENESWSNNATGMIQSLFSARLSNTQADPQKRFEFIDECLITKKSNEIAVIIKILDSALQTDHFMRTVGVEHNALDKSLRPWEPKVWEDVFGYYLEATKRLIVIMQKNPYFEKHVKKVFANHLRGLFRLKQIETIELFFEVVKSTQNSFYPEALESIDHILEYDIKDGQNEKEILLLEKWQKELAPQKVKNKLRHIVSLPPYKHLKDENGQYIDKPFLDAKEFAQNCDLVEIKEHFEVLLSGEQRQAYTFGKFLIERVDDKKAFLLDVLKSMQSISEKLNISFFVGLLDGVKSLDYALWQELLKEVQETSLLKYYADFIVRSKPSIEELLRLSELIKSGDVDVLTCRGYANGQALSHLKPEELQKFLYSFIDLNTQAPWICLDIAFMYSFSIGYWSENTVLLKKIILKIDFTVDMSEIFTDLHDLQEAVKRVVETEHDEEFIQKLTVNLFELLQNVQDYNAVRNMKELFLYLLENYTKSVLPVAIESFGELDATQKMSFSMVMQNFNSDFVEAEFKSDFDKIIIKNKEFVKFLIAAINITKKQENGKHKEFTPFVKGVLEKFANDKEILRAISSNLNSFSWSGSVVPYYENLIELMEPFTKSDTPSLNQWAKQEIEYYKKRIESEKIRDEEQEWGVY